MRHAHGLALAQDRPGCREQVRTAYRLVARADTHGDDEPDTIGRHGVMPYVRAHEAYCALLLGPSPRRGGVLTETLTACPGDYRQDAALARTWLALAHAAAGDLDAAAADGTAALTLTTTAGSVRAIRALGRLTTSWPAPAAPPAG